MEYQQALIIGRRRRSDAALALSMYIQERATDICAVKPAKGQGMDAKEWEPVGEQSFKEICIRTSLSGDKEAYLVLTDADGTVRQAGSPCPCKRRFGHMCIHRETQNVLRYTLRRTPSSSPALCPGQLRRHG